MDELLGCANSEKDILKWANGRSETVNTEHVNIDGKTLLVVLANPPTGNSRTYIYVYEGADKNEKKGTNGWGLLLSRCAGTATVTVKVDKKAKQLVFRSRAGKTLLILPTENLDFWAEGDGEAIPP